MDKNAIKRFAVWARRELISRVSQRAALYEITDKGYGDASADSVLGRVMSAEEKRQRHGIFRTASADDQDHHFCRVCGVMVSAALLKELGPLLMDIHGQHETRFLMDPEMQIGRAHV